jgi:hypothetical protein
MASSDLAIPQNLVGPGSSPKILYVYFLLRLCSNYFETMRVDSEQSGNIDAATAALIAFCPDKTTRESLWFTYKNTKTKKDDKGEELGTLTASVMAIGELISYLSETLEFTETVTAGFL